jgi:two-component system, NtrC family, nitrogen regulation sensor histidine kinase NtrY
MQTMTELPAQKVAKRRSPPWIIGGLVFALLVFLVYLQTSDFWRWFSDEPVSIRLLLLALSSLNFIAFIILAFILLRNLLKLSRERRSMQLGAKIKTRLLIYFVGLSILPIIAMAVFSYLFLNRAVERWFTQIPINVIDDARNVKNLRQNEIARMLAKVLEKQEINNQILTETAVAGNLLFIRIVSRQNEILANSERQIEPNEKAELDKKLAESDVISAEFPDGRRLIIVPDLSPENRLGETIEKSAAEFEKLKDNENTFRYLGLTVLGLLTFLLIFISTWMALYLARGLSAPIKALAEGSEEIAQGNFSHRVSVLAEDELALLVDNFNQMSATLEANTIERQERRRYIETVLQTLSTGVVSLNAADEITTINQAAIKMLRLETTNLKNLGLSELVTDDNRLILEKLINRAKRVGQAVEQTVLTHENFNGNGGNIETTPVALTASALPDKNGVVLVIEDLTELLQAQRASAWQEVARRMAHEIKNPLTPIQLSAERIAKRFAQVISDRSEVLSSTFPTQDSRLQTQDFKKIIDESTATIINEVSSLKSMVDEFSRFARLPKVKLEGGDLNGLIEQTVFLYEDREVKIETDLAENLPKTMLDDEQMKRVFVNLIENANEAFESNQEDKRIFIKTWHNVARDLVIAEVSDNGHGISPSDFQKLFQPYFSTKGRGTGLGLAIVQRIIAEHGAKIRAGSNVPKGAKFIVEIPTAS